MKHDYLVTFDFSGTVLSTIAVKKAERTERACSDSGHHAQSVCSLEIEFDIDILAALSTAVVAAKVAILQDGIRYFTGVVPPTWESKDRGATGGPKPDTDPISLEVVDSSDDLAYELSDDDAIAWENQTVCAPAHPESSLVHRLLAKTGYNLVAITTTIPTVIPAYSSAQGKVGDLLDELLYPYGYTWRMDLFDQVTLQPWHFDSPAAVASPNEDTLRADFGAQKIEREADAVELTWWTQKVKNQALLYMADLPFGEDSLRSGYPVQPGYLWPDEANVETTWFEYQDTSLSTTLKNGKKTKSTDFTQIILTKNHTLNVSVEEGLVPSGAHVFQNKRAKIAFSNPFATSKRIYYCDVYGDVVYRAAANKVTCRVTPSGKNIKTIECPSIVNQSDADKAASMIADLYRSPFRITCSSQTEYTIGSVASVSDSYMGVTDVLCLIVERRFDPSIDEWTYKCVTIKPLVIDIAARASHVIEDSPKTKDEDPRIQALSTRSGITGILSNTSHVVSTAEDGSGGDYSGCESTMSVIVGKADDSANWTFSAVSSEGVTGDLEGRTYTVTGMSTDSGYVDITATRALRPILTLRFSISKAKRGLTGSATTVYSLILDAKAVSRSVLGAYSPASLTARAIAQTGNADPLAYAGRFLVQESVNGTDYTTVYDSDVDESNIFIEPSADIKTIRVRLYRSGGFSTFLDESIIPIVDDGQTGSQGAQGPTVTVIAPSTVFRGMPGMGFSPSSIIFSLSLNGIIAGAYQWQVHNGTSWQVIDGATSATYTVAQAMVESSKTYRCVINGTFVSQAVTVTKTIVDRANLVDLSGWTAGASIPPSGYDYLGTVAENALEAILDTYGGNDVGWKCGADLAADADGGFEYLFPCDPSKTYRFVVYVRKSNSVANGRTYLGCSQAQTENLDGSTNNDPYFVDGIQLLTGGDYLLVGVVHPAGFSGADSGLAGIYDAKTFEKILDGSEFRMKAGASDQRMRAALRLSTDITEYQWLWKPMIHELQEKELTKDSLMLACQMEFRTHSAFIGSLVGQEAFFDKLMGNEFFVEKLAAKVIQFRESVGSISEKTPAAGDLLAYLGKDPRRQGDASRIFELAIKEYIGNNGGSGYQEEWMSHFLTKKSGNTIGLILAGVLSACSGVKSNPGMIWISRTHPFGTSYILSLCNNGGIYLAGGEGGKLSRSTDAGKTWSSLITTPFGTSAINAIGYGNGVFIASAGNAKIARSLDGGLTWGSLISNPFGTEGIVGIRYGDGVWIAVCTYGKMARSTNDGLSWGSLISTPNGSGFFWDLHYANSVWIAACDYGIIRSTDAGLTWTLHTPFSSSALVNSITYGNGVWLACGGAGRISRSTDGGVTWSALISNPVGSALIPDCVFGSGVFVAVAGNGKIIKSSDGGKTWAEPGVDISYQPYGAQGSWMCITYDDDKKRFTVGGYNGSAAAGYIITSDWLEAGAGIIETGTTPNGWFVKLATGLTIQWGNKSGTADASNSNNFGTTSGTCYFGAITIALPIAFGGTINDVFEFATPDGGSGTLRVIRAAPYKTLSQLYCQAWAPTSGGGIGCNWIAIGPTA